MKRNLTGDERTVLHGSRMFGLLGPVSSSFTLAWLASHRGRLRTLILGGRRLSLLVVYDTQGSRKVEHSDREVDAIGRLTFGGEEA